MRNNARPDMKTEYHHNAPIATPDVHTINNYQTEHDHRLSLAIHSRLASCQAVHKIHLQYHQLRNYVEKTLERIKNDSEYDDWCIKSIRRVRADECLMEANRVAPPKPGAFKNLTERDKFKKRKFPPAARNFHYLDFVIEFDTSYYWSEEHNTWCNSIFTRDDVDLIDFMTADLPEAFMENLESEVENETTGMKKWFPNWEDKLVLEQHFDNGIKRGHNYENGHEYLKSRGENKHFCLTRDSRKTMLEEGLVGMYRANASIPDGVLVISLDKWVVLDHRLDNIGMDAFGIRLWPKRSEYCDVLSTNHVKLERGIDEVLNLVKGEFAGAEIAGGGNTNVGVTHGGVKSENMTTLNPAAMETSGTKNIEPDGNDKKQTVVKKYRVNKEPDLFDTLSKLADDEIDREKVLSHLTFQNKDVEAPVAHNFTVGDGFSFDADYYQRRGRYALMSKFITTWKWLRHQYNDQLACMTDWFIIQLSYNCCMVETDSDLKRKNRINLGCLIPYDDEKDGIRTYGSYKITLSQAMFNSFTMLSGKGLVNCLSSEKQHVLMADSCHYQKETKYRSLLNELNKCQLYTLADFAREETLESDGLEITSKNCMKSISSKETVRNLCQVFKTMILFGNHDVTDDLRDPRLINDSNQPEYKIFGRIEPKVLTLHKKNHQPLDYEKALEQTKGLQELLKDKGYERLEKELIDRCYFLKGVVSADVKQTELSRYITDLDDNYKFKNKKLIVQTGGRRLVSCIENVLLCFEIKFLIYSFVLAIFSHFSIKQSPYHQQYHSDYT